MRTPRYIGTPALDYESQVEFSVSLVAVDSSGLSALATLQIRVVDENELPTLFVPGHAKIEYPLPIGHSTGCNCLHPTPTAMRHSRSVKSIRGFTTNLMLHLRNSGHVQLVVDGWERERMCSRIR